MGVGMNDYKKLIVVLMCFFLLVTSGCTTIEKETEEKQTSMFVEIETADVWRVVYHKETKVMYAVSGGFYNVGNFTVLVNADGTPMIYGG